MNRILTFISGKKTYILVALGLIVQSAHSLGYLHEDAANTILACVGLGSIATLKAGLQRMLVEALAATPPDPPAPPPAV
jgi:hypothetical protein